MTSRRARIPMSFRRMTAPRSARSRCVTPARMLAFLMMFVGAATTSTYAKSAEDYYHGASYQYVAGKIQEASVEAEEGLRLHPRDAKLRMLAEHLRDMKDQQRGDQGQGEGQDKNGNPDRNQDGKNDRDDKDENPDDRNRDGDEGDEGDEGKDGDAQGERPDEDARNEPRNDETERDGDGRDDNAPQPRAMSEEEAERLLNSFADDEKKEQAERRKVIRSRAGTEQDW